MSLARETVLLGIALILFGTWIEISGLGGWPFAVSGLGMAALGFLGSVVSASRSPPTPGGPGDDETT
jgi:hypothetical protein